MTLWEWWRDRRVRRETERDETEQLLRESFLFEDAAEHDLVDEAFKDYQRSIADLLDEHPARSEELIRGLEAATTEWERTEFRIVTHYLRRDLRFRWAIRRAMRTKAST